MDNGTLSGNSIGGNDRGNVYTTNSFSLTGGFKLEVNYAISDLSNINANRVNIGLIDKDSIPTVQDSTTYVTTYLSANQDRYGIGLNMTTDYGPQGLNFANDEGAGTLTSLSNAQTLTIGTHTWVLEMGTAGDWSYSIDGATATSGTIAGGFDLSREYHFFGYVQDYRNSRIEINSVTLTQVPEPGVFSLFALTGLVLCRRRRGQR